MTTQQDWPARLTRAIAGEIRHHRGERGWSAQQLADECARVGMSIPRSVLADLENGRRASIAAAELLTIAAALEIPPGLLLCPVGRADSAEVLPGYSVPPFRALQWLAGESPLPQPGRADVLTSWVPASGPAAVLTAYRSNDLAGREAMNSAGRAHEYRRHATAAAGDGERAAYTAAASAEEATAGKALDQAAQMREWAASEGYLAPRPVAMHEVRDGPLTGRPAGDTGTGQ
jgi:transcriptional regulator with XRE-family HTH domain